MIKHLIQKIQAVLLKPKRTLSDAPASICTVNEVEDDGDEYVKHTGVGLILTQYVPAGRLSKLNSPELSVFLVANPTELHAPSPRLTKKFGIPIVLVPSLNK